jgi:hypothetical protein
MACTMVSEMSANPNLNDPKVISQLGTRIYEAKYKSEYEKLHIGKFLAINILDESATLGATATEALTMAKQQHPKGFFHLIRIGHSGAFEVGMAYRNVHTDRLLR